MNNPWEEMQVKAEKVFHDFDHPGAEALVRGEYQGAPSSFRHEGCSRDGVFHYKATIGVMKCYGCGALAYSDGEIL